MKARALSVAPGVGIFARSLFPLSLLISGCASDSDSVDKRLAAMREEIQKLQNDNDRVTERLEAIELKQAGEEAKGAKARQEKSDPVVSRPRLKVVHLAPGQSGEETEAEPAATPAQGSDKDKTPRVILKGQGKDLELQQGG